MSRSRRIALITSRGLTLFEMVIATVLLALFFGAVFETIVTGLRIVKLGDDHSELQQQLAAVLDRMARDIMVADDVDEAQDARFQFDTPSVNNVDYVYSGGALTRDDASSAQVTVLRNITALDFNYVDSAGSTLATPVAGASEDTIRVVQITVTLTKGSTSLSMTSAAYLRNI